jgi:hypothetical protein
MYFSEAGFVQLLRGKFCLPVLESRGADSMLQTPLCGGQLALLLLLDESFPFECFFFR